MSDDFVPGWFRRDGETFVPQALATSLWSAEQMHGVAVSGLLALALEDQVSASGRSDLSPTRYHVDLFRPARMVASRPRVTVVREGPRLMLVDVVLLQESADSVGDGEAVARASALFLRRSADPAGRAWSQADRAVPPPAEVVGDSAAHHVPFFCSDADWSQNFGEHQNSGRHATWQTAMPVVVEEQITPFQAAASVADATSMVTNWGNAGIEYINTDIDLSLARLPDGISLGLRATDHVVADGLAVGTAEVFDRSGPLGTATVTAMVNSRRTVDLGGPENPDNAGLRV